MSLSRREFFKLCAYTLTGIICTVNESFSLIKKEKLYEARFYRTNADKTVNCLLCFRQCTIPDGKRGFCRNRENQRGVLYSLVYGKPSPLQFDPIEKEPMFHNLPGTKILCIGTASCNFRCKFCHNWHLSQKTIEELSPHILNISPDEIVKIAKDRNMGLSFTYNEPTVFYEFMFDIAKLGRQHGLNTIFHTNGGIQEQPLRELLKYMRGVTVDLKGFTANYYKDVSFAEMTPVLRTLKVIKESGNWLEIVNLVIPTLNDDMEKIREMCIWIKENLGQDVPLHFTRFFPAYKMTHLPPTPVKTLEQARDIAIKEGIRFVYIGNVPGHKYNSTYCPKCNKRVITRIHFSVIDINLKEGKCRNCGYPIPGLWDI